MNDKYIEIMGNEIVVKTVKPEDLNNGDPNGLYLGRFTTEPELTIKLSSKLSKKKREAVLLHECFHAMLWVSGVGCALTMDIEEQIVLMFEHNIKKSIKELKGI